METTRTIVLILHVIAGFVALTVGFVPFVAKKGSKLHTTTGWIFCYAMLFVALSAFGLTIYRFNPFLLMVGLLTLYTTVTGYRGLRFRRDLATIGQPRDWALLVACGIALGLTVWQTLERFGTENVSALVLIGFFALSLLNLLRQDGQLFSGRRRVQGKGWIRYHIVRISGAYIATITAFLVNNVHTDPAFVAWLLPTVIGVPAIVYFKRQYGEKKAARSSVSVAK